jgi:Bcr/CflA subfamily drug resistance transporter
MLHTRFMLFTIVLIFTFGQVATDLYLPSLVNIATTLDTDTFMVQLTITTYITSMMITQPIYGIASDAYGRKLILLFGLSIATCGTIICIYANSINILLLGRFVQGLGAGAGTTVCRAIMRDLYSGLKFIKMASYLSVSGMLVIVSAPIMGGYIEHYFNWRVNFLILLFLGIIILTNLIIKFPETNQNCQKENIKIHIITNNFLILLKTKKFLVYTICSTLALANVFAWITAGSVLLQNTYELNAITLGWNYFLAGSMHIVGNIFNRYTVYKIGSTNLLHLGFSIQLFVGTILIILYVNNLDNAYSVIILMSIMMFGISLVFPNANAGALNDFTKIAGTASALFSIIQTLGAVLSSACIAMTTNHTIIPISICFILLSIIGLKLCNFLKINGLISINV